MPPRARLVLAGILVLLVAAATLIALSGRRLRGIEVAGRTSPGEEVLRLDGARPVRLDIEWEGSAVALRQAAPGWVAISGAPQGDPDAAEVVLARLAGLRRRGTVSGGGSAESLRPYGLDLPRAVIEVGLDDGRALRVALGRGTGEDGVAFVQAPDGSVAVVRSDDATALEAEIARLFSGKALDPARTGG